MPKKPQQRKSQTPAAASTAAEPKSLKRAVPGATSDHGAGALAAAAAKTAFEDSDDENSNSQLSFDSSDVESVSDGGEDVVDNLEEDDDGVAGEFGSLVVTGEIVPDAEELAEAAPKALWRPGVDPLADGEELVYDSSAYQMLHRLSMEWSCLSLDVMRDAGGYNRSAFPHSVTFVTGSQADRAADNQLYVVRTAGLCKTKHDDDTDDDDDNDNDDGNAAGEAEPSVSFRRVAHHGCVNRVRAMPQRSAIVASWSETKAVMTWDLSAQLRSLDSSPAETATAAADASQTSDTRPLMVFTGHPDEGYALDWSTTTPGRLLSGCCGKAIHLWEPRADAGTWAIGSQAFRGHKSSVEDLQWSPNQANVFASASADRTIRVWDCAAGYAPALTIRAHEADVNVISWHPRVPHLLASGSDDGSFRIWDMRAFSPQGATPAAEFQFHRSPITSVKWDPAEDSQLAVCCERMATVWDLSVERDTETAQLLEDNPDVPPQLLFLHAGQEQIKELCYHPQIPGCIVTTAVDGFNLLIPDIQVVEDGGS